MFVNQIGSVASLRELSDPSAIVGGVFTPDLEARIVADSRDRVAWLRARSQGITATDVAHLSTPASILRAAQQKLRPSSFSGNAYTDHGRRREPEIAAWVEREHGIAPSSALFCAVVERRHLATPDGISQDAEGRILLAEIKTTNKPWRTIPRHYLRQVWWQQHVTGAERTLFAWEEHRDFRPLHDEPKSVWIDRDDAEIGTLVTMATALIDELYRMTTGQSIPQHDLSPREQAMLREATADAYRALALID
ncbi:YqaJ viral recombinase family protein [Microbacterium excoecariae]|uniref:YqaJ viral recombinase family protein n=1 Tax=Microbacterium excoecariae TaxID=2715210 RepID=UPI00140933CE|nr:YqaJ viral recombinase family protein [Microbacterium excoecariae]NHI17816.1 YqaJ viral recombinase family protein [Microbacterium excoecariae]